VRELPDAPMKTHTRSAPMGMGMDAMSGPNHRTVKQDKLVRTTAANRQQLPAQIHARGLPDVPANTHIRHVRIRMMMDVRNGLPPKTVRTVKSAAMDSAIKSNLYVQMFAPRKERLSAAKII
jgi:hypothetical protein